VRNAQDLGKSFEFKHAKTHHTHNEWFMERMARTSFRGIVVIYDKDAMTPPWAWGKNDDLLAQLLMRGLLHLTRREMEKPAT